MRQPRRAWWRNVRVWKHASLRAASSSWVDDADCRVNSVCSVSPAQRGSASTACCPESACSSAAGSPLAWLSTSRESARWARTTVAELPASTSQTSACRSVAASARSRTAGRAASMADCSAGQGRTGGGGGTVLHATIAVNERRPTTIRGITGFTRMLGASRTIAWNQQLPGARPETSCTQGQPRHTLTLLPIAGPSQPATIPAWR